jgi:hypothetical protein
VRIDDTAGSKLTSPVFAGAAAMSNTFGDLTVLVHVKEERFGHPVRVHRPAAHQYCHGRAEAEGVRDILSETSPQQLAQVAGLHLPRLDIRHLTIHNSSLSLSKRRRSVRSVRGIGKGPLGVSSVGV